jgi:deoxycytidylate deaminase
MKHLCKKRIVTCILLDEDDKVLALGVNQCQSPDGCRREGVVSSPEDYRFGKHNECRSRHAEVDAISRLSCRDKPVRAIISGHTFACQACREFLEYRGVKSIEVYP